MRNSYREIVIFTFFMDMVMKKPVFAVSKEVNHVSRQFISSKK